MRWRAARTMIGGWALLAGLAVTVVGLLPGGTAQAAAAAQAGRISPSPVVLIGIPGLRWSDISATATPILWRLAERGAVGSLSVHAIRTGSTCPADAWLTINAGARAIAESSATGPCVMPAVVPAAGQASSAGPATVPAMAGIVQNNGRYCYNPSWGVLANPARAWGCGKPTGSPSVPPAGCALAIGPGGALALAAADGEVAHYLAASSAPGPALRRCPLTIADLGALPAAAPGQTTSARQRALAAADQEAGRMIVAAPAGARIVVAGLGDDASAQLRAIIVAGPGFGPGLLTADSTRQPGIVTITDLTPTLLGWRGASVPVGLTGSALRTSARGSLASTVRTLIGQDTAAQVYFNTAGWFFLSYGVAEAVAFALIAWLMRGDDDARVGRRVAAYRIAGVCSLAVPAGTFLASLLPWPVLAHPALVLYGLSLAWAAVIAAVGLAGPWRRSAIASLGFVCAVTIAVIGVDVMTGSHLQLGTPFGLSALEAGRFYGIGNNALGIYAPAAILCAAWAGLAALGRQPFRPEIGAAAAAAAPSAGQGTAAGATAVTADGQRAGGASRPAVLAAGLVGLVVVIVCGWPAFGTKVGGTIALVPAFLVLLAALARIRISARLAGLVLVSGLAVIVLIAVVSYNVPSAGPSDISNFVRQVLHGDALAILHRKVNANVGSLTETWFTPVVPLIVLITGAMLAWPDRMRQRTLAAAVRAEPLLRPLLFAIWLVGLLGWLADDSGVSVAAAALPMALPAAIVLATTFGGAAEARRRRDRRGSGGKASNGPSVTSDGPVQAPGRSG